MVAVRLLKRGHYCSGREAFRFLGIRLLRYSAGIQQSQPGVLLVENRGARVALCGKTVVVVIKGVLVLGSFHVEQADRGRTHRTLPKFRSVAKFINRRILDRATDLSDFVFFGA